MAEPPNSDPAGAGGSSGSRSPGGLRPARTCLDSGRLRARLRGERGYTSTELLVVMSLLGIIVATLATIFVSASRAEADMNLRFRAQQEARLALEQLRREAHCATSMTPAAPTSLVTFTFGAHCDRALDRGARAILVSATTNSQTALQANVVTGAFPAPPFNVLVEAEIMRVTATSATTPQTWTVQRAEQGTAAAAHNASVHIQNGPYRVTWCTSGSGSRFALRRMAEVPGSCAGGRATADFLTLGDVFCFRSASPTRRATLGVHFRVAVDGATRLYQLRDDIVFRNAPRTGTPGSNCP